MRIHNNRLETVSSPCVTRRECLRYFIGGWGLIMTLPLSLATSAEIGYSPRLLEKYQGEKLRYQIGYGLIDHVGDAETGFLPTDVTDIYRIRLEGRGIGFINFLLGGVTYTYTSFCRYLADQDRLQPVYFELKKERGTTQRLRSIQYNYKTRQIIFQQTNPAGDIHQKKEPLMTGRIYEDYLTLFYNFRHGLYGSLERNRQYRLPLYTKAQMHPVKLDIADVETEKSWRSRERNQTNKDFFIQFQINPEDVSSGSGQILGWLSADGTPIKGTIEDVVFFGDLWGDLIEKQIVRPGPQVIVPAGIKDII